MSASAAPFNGTTRVLLAEDNRLNQRITQLILQRLGHRLDIVDNGLAAFEAVQQRRYSVVLMDVDMPVMDGLEATRRIRAHFRELDRPYIVAVTASAERSACHAAGMDNYMQKPTRIDDLARMVETALTTALEWRHHQGFAD